LNPNSSPQLVAIGILTVIIVITAILTVISRVRSFENPEKRPLWKLDRLRAAIKVLWHGVQQDLEASYTPELDPSSARAELTPDLKGYQLYGTDEWVFELGDRQRYELACAEKKAELEALEEKCCARRRELRDLEDGTWEWDAGSFASTRYCKLNELECIEATTHLQIHPGATAEGGESSLANLSDI
jgi:hypothetical protein